MKFSLLNVESRDGNYVSSHWLQNHVGTLETALHVAIAVKAANSDRIRVAVVDEVSSPCPYLTYWSYRVLLAEPV